MNGKYRKWLTGATSDTLLKEYIGILDGVLDFRFQEIIRDNLAWKQNISLADITEELHAHYTEYPASYVLPSFLDNHDMNRFLFECKNNSEKLKRAAEIQFAQQQPPIIYYGTETGMTHEKSVWDTTAYGDLQARQPMNWENINNEIFRHYQKLIKTRTA